MWRSNVKRRGHKSNAMYYNNTYSSHSSRCVCVRRLSWVRSLVSNLNDASGVKCAFVVTCSITEKRQPNYAYIAIRQVNYGSVSARKNDIHSLLLTGNRRMTTQRRRRWSRLKQLLNSDHKDIHQFRLDPVLVDIRFMFLLVLIWLRCELDFSADNCSSFDIAGMEIIRFNWPLKWVEPDGSRPING